MKSFVLAAALAACIFSAANCSAACCIKLENGAEIAAACCRVENGILKFSYLDGTAGIPLEAVAEARKCRGRAGKNPLPCLPKAPAYPEIKRAEKKNPEKSRSGVEQCREKFMHLREKIRVQKRNFRISKSADHEKAGEKAWKRLTRLKIEQKRLKKRVLMLYNGKLPGWWK